MLALLNPNSWPESPITHCDSGGLSTVMKFCASSDPNSNASQFARPGLGSGRVELVAHAVDGDVPQVEHRGRDQ